MCLLPLSSFCVVSSCKCHYTEHLLCPQLGSRMWPSPGGLPATAEAVDRPWFSPSVWRTTCWTASGLLLDEVWSWFLCQVVQDGAVDCPRNPSGPGPSGGRTGSSRRAVSHHWGPFLASAWCSPGAIAQAFLWGDGHAASRNIPMCPWGSGSMNPGTRALC